MGPGGSGGALLTVGNGAPVGCGDTLASFKKMVNWRCRFKDSGFRLQTAEPA